MKVENTKTNLQKGGMLLDASGVSQLLHKGHDPHPVRALLRRLFGVLILQNVKKGVRKVQFRREFKQLVDNFLNGINPKVCQSCSIC